MTRLETDISDELFIGLLLLITGWNRKTLAAKAGLDRSAISRYERGKRKAQRRTRQRLAAAAGLTLQEVEELLPAILRLRSRTQERNPPSSRRTMSTISLKVGEAVAAAVALEDPDLVQPVPP